MHEACNVKEHHACLDNNAVNSTIMSLALVMRILQLEQGLLAVGH